MKQYNDLLRPRTRHVMRRWGLAAALFAMSAAMGGLAWQRHLADAADAERIARLRAQTMRQRPVPPKPMDAKETAQWQQLQGARDFPWEQVFQAIENASTADVELLDFAPDKSHRRIVLHGEAKDAEALTSYLDVLTEQKQLHGVYLARRQAIERDKLVTVEFEIRGALK